ncbi:MAG: flagellar export chaperone FliS [Acidobacteriia bacterium]|nr:flagellar export chaperone FliS [Terriglobia bacterium]
MYQSAHDAYLESRVLSAGPLELIEMLYQGAIGAVEDARNHLRNGRIAERARAISKACAILGELTASLNHEAGGELPGRLAGLYGYMQRKLLEANFQQSDSQLAEVLRLLSTLSEGWAEISRPPAQLPAQTAWSQSQAGYAAEQESAYTAGNWSL